MTAVSTSPPAPHHAVASNALSLHSQVAAFAAASHGTLLGIAHHWPELAIISAGSLVAYAITRRYIPIVAETLYQRNLYGIDINKTTAEERAEFARKRRAGAASDEKDVTFRRRAVPESVGILVGAVYLCVVMLLVVLLQPAAAISALSGPLTTITVMLLLGFVDDVLDVRWRYKMPLSMVGTLPLIMAYDGSASVIVPPTLVRHGKRFAVAALGLGDGSVASSITSLFRSSGGARDGLLARTASTSATVRSFFTSAPVASLEATVNNWLRASNYITVSRSGYLILSLGPLYLMYLSLLCTFCTNSINILAGVNGVEVGQSMVIAVASVLYNVCQLRLENVLDASVQKSSPWLSSDHQIRALLLLMPFIGASYALWQQNRYPARVFVGDSYTYFAGTVLAVAGVAGVYSKTLLLFFAPQLLNFAISLPQLFGIVVCPRHRVPRWIPEKDTLTNSHNYTVLNLILWLRGDMHERTLTRRVLTLQAVTCALGFLVRYLIASWMYDRVE